MDGLNDNNIRKQLTPHSQQLRISKSSAFVYSVQLYNGLCATVLSHRHNTSCEYYNVFMPIEIVKPVDYAANTPQRPGPGVVGVYRRTDQGTRPDDLPAAVLGRASLPPSQ